jgi:hypothetical protein
MLIAMALSASTPVNAAPGEPAMRTRPSGNGRGML